MGDGALSFSTLIALGALSLVPLLLIAATSFAKMAIVFSVLRNALGAPDLPSGAIVTALAAILSAYVMAPVGSEMVAASAPAFSAVDTRDPLSPRSQQALLDIAGRASAPLSAFLSRNADAPERALFAQLARRARPDQPAPSEQSLLIALPAFLITELKEAFQIGLLVLLPFIVIDLVVASVLGAVGMPQLTPAAVALPLKLLLFVLVSGWTTLSQALVAGYR